MLTRRPVPALSMLAAPLLLLACGGGEESLEAFSARMVLDREELRIPETDLGVPASGELRVGNQGTGPLDVDVQLEAGPLLVTSMRRLTVAPGAWESVRVTFLALAEGQVGGTLVLAHNGEGDGAVLRVPVVASTRALPDCNDDNPCTLDRVEGRECVHLPVGGACDDGSACTTGDRCVAGACVGVAVTCDDGVACTVDRCDETLGCVAEPSAARCDDGDPCTTDTCLPVLPGDGCTHGVAPTGTPCGALGCGTVALCVAGACTEVPTPEGFPCEDGDACTAGDHCASGSCVPGPGQPFSVGTPRVLTESVFPEAAGEPERQAYAEGALYGREPVDVVGAVPLEDGTGSSLLAWRAATGTWSGCVSSPASCAYAPPRCTDVLDVDYAGSPLELMVARVREPTASVDPPAILDTAALYEHLRQRTGSAMPAGGTPTGSVSAVVGVPRGDHLLVAVMVHFNDACADCGWSADPRPTPPEAPTCLPAGWVLALYRVAQDGMVLLDASHVRQHAGGPLSPQALLGTDGLPLMGLSVVGQEAALAVMARGDANGTEPAGGAALCDAENCGGGAAHVLVRRMGLVPGDTARVGDAMVQRQPVTVPWPGADGTLRDFRLLHVDGELRAGWKQRASTAPNLVACDAWISRGEWLDAVELPLPAQSFVPVVQQSLVLDSERVPGVPGWMTWTVDQLQGESCMDLDVVNWVDESGEHELLRQPSSNVLVSVDAAELHGRPVVSAVDMSGGLTLALPGPLNAPHALSPAFDPALATSFSSRARLVLSVPAGGARAGVFTSAAVGINRGSQPTGALAAFALGCGAALPAASP